MEYRTSLLQFFLLYTFGACLGSFPTHTNFDPCLSHMEITELWRRPGHSETVDECDMTLVTAWYAMTLELEPSMIPTQCLQDHTCGAEVPLRVDLEGQQMPEVGGNISAVLCGSANVLGKIDCCVLRQKIIIKKCSNDLIIYHLPRQDRCNAAICAQKMGETIPEEYLAKHGDPPRSVLNTARSVPTTTELHTFGPDCPEGLRPCPDGRTCGPVCPSTTTHAPLTPTTKDVEIVRPLGTTDQQTTATYLTSTTPPLPTTTVPASGLENTTSSPDEEAEDSTSVFSSTNSTSVFSSINLNVTETSPTNASGTDTSKVTNETSTEIQASKVSITTDSSPNLTESARNATVARVSVLNKEPNAVDSFSTLNVTSSANDMGSGDEATSQRDTVTLKRDTVTLEPVTSAMADGVCEDSDGVRFVVKGDFEEHAFRSSLMHFAGNYIQQLTNNSADNMTFDNFTIVARTKEDYNTTSVDVSIDNPVTHCLIPPKSLVWVVMEMNFTETLKQNTGLELLAVCAVAENCEEGLIQESPRRQSLFEKNLAAFATIISISALCLLVLILVLLYLHCSKRGTWVLAEHEEKCAGPLAVESPLTDTQIMHCETETALTANGAHVRATPDLDIPAADEDNGWVVPLEQGPNAKGVANTTEDTRF